jgi:hypothetical protein
MVTWFLIGFAAAFVVLMFIAVTVNAIANFSGLKKMEELLDKREALLNERAESQDEAWEEFKAQKKKLHGFAKGLEARAQELGYVGREAWQDDEE